MPPQPELTPEQVRAINEWLGELTDPNSEASRRLAEIRARHHADLEAELEAIRRSAMITAEDLAIVINVRD